MQEEDKKIQKLKTLLLSEDIDNVKLGLAVLESFEKIPSLLESLVALYIIYYHEDFELDITDCLYQNCTPQEYELIIKTIEFSYKNSYQDNALDNLYIALEKIQFLDVAEIALLVYNKTQMGIRYCIEKKIAPVEALLKQKVKNGCLNLHKCNLSELPTEVVMLQDLFTIDISHNHVKDFPDEWQGLDATIIFQDNPLTEEAILKLEKWFPTMMANHYYYEDFNSHFNNNAYPDALKVIQKCISLNAEYASYWNAMGVVLQRMERWKESLECFDKALSIYPDDPLTYSNKALNHHINQEYEASLTAALQGLALYDKKQNLSPQWLPVLYFRKGQALYYLDRLEESEEAYFESLKLKPQYGASQYNLACIYILWNQREKVIEYLNKAIANDSKYYQEAKEDVDFEPYKEDEEFWSLIEKP